MALTGTIDQKGIVEEVIIEEEKPIEVSSEKQEDLFGEQQQFEGTDGWGCIEVSYSDGNIKMQNVKWELRDKFFHILEKDKEVEEGIFIPLTKVVHFSFYYKAPIQKIENSRPCGLDECDKPLGPDCNNCTLNPDNPKNPNVPKTEEEGCGVTDCTSVTCDDCNSKQESKKSPKTENEELPW